MTLLKGLDFRKMLHLRYLSGPWIRLCFNLIKISGKGPLINGLNWNYMKYSCDKLDIIQTPHVCLTELLEEILRYSVTQEEILQMFFKIDALKNSVLLTGKHLCWILKACNLIKKRPQHWRFLVNITKFSKPAFLQNTSGGFFC